MAPGRQDVGEPAGTRSRLGELEEAVDLTERPHRDRQVARDGQQLSRVGATGADAQPGDGEDGDLGEGQQQPECHTTPRCTRQSWCPAEESAGSGTRTRSVSVATVPAARIVRAPASALSRRALMVAWASKYAPWAALALPTKRRARTRATGSARHSASPARQSIRKSRTSAVADSRPVTSQMAAVDGRPAALPAPCMTRAQASPAANDDRVPCLSSWRTVRTCSQAVPCPIDDEASTPTAASVSALAVMTRPSRPTHRPTPAPATAAPTAAASRAGMARLAPAWTTSRMRMADSRPLPRAAVANRSLVPSAVSVSTGVSFRRASYCPVAPTSGHHRAAGG